MRPTALSGQACSINRDTASTETVIASSLHQGKHVTVERQSVTKVRITSANLPSAKHYAVLAPQLGSRRPGFAVTIGSKVRHRLGWSYLAQACIDDALQPRCGRVVQDWRGACGLVH